MQQPETCHTLIYQTAGDAEFDKCVQQKDSAECGKSTRSEANEVNDCAKNGVCNAGAKGAGRESVGLGLSSTLWIIKQLNAKLKHCQKGGSAKNRLAWPAK